MSGWAVVAFGVALWCYLTRETWCYYLYKDRNMCHVRMLFWQRREENVWKFATWHC